MRPSYILFALALLASCRQADLDSPNRWSDERLLPVLDAQEHRDAPSLCALLKNADAELRAAAALALASVQDTVARGCLLPALVDSVPNVRAQAAFALSWIADSIVARRLRIAGEAERDVRARAALLHAAFRAELTTREHDAQWLISFLESDDPLIRLLAAQKLMRGTMPLGHMEHGMLHAAHVERDPEVRALLVLSLRRGALPASLDSLRRWVARDASAGVRIAAIRTLAKRVEEPSKELHDALLDKEAGVRQAALDALAAMPGGDASACLRIAESGADTLCRIQLLGLAIRHGAEPEAERARRMLRALSGSASAPHRRAAAIRAQAVAWEPGFHVELLSVMQSDAPAVVRQAAFEALVSITRDIMARSRYTTAEDQYRQLGNVVQSAIYTKDAGLVCAAAELLQQEEAAAIRILLPPTMDGRALASLHPIRDLEAILLLKQAIAKRDGGPPLLPAPPAFNHPIDPVRLRALKQAQRYRIVTNKGAIIIATDVNNCPGSSLAFDSLVTAGYYNGKAFHRMVPNFVVQGGCPRGDGYGGMPWTLRTEIGRKPFTAGSVGLASAGRDTESCQFFITHSATPHLDGRYTRFGEVVEGMDVVWRLQVGDVMLQIERVD